MQFSSVNIFSSYNNGRDLILFIHFFRLSILVEFISIYLSARWPLATRITQIIIF